MDKTNSSVKVFNVINEAEKSSSKTILMSSVQDLTPVWILKPTALMRNASLYNPTEDDLILEARGLLAVRYGWRGRQLDVAECFDNDSFKSSTHVLKEWDSYNAMQQRIAEEK